MIQELHLFFRVKPVLSALHDGEISANLVCEPGYGFSGSQVVFSTI